VKIAKVEKTRSKLRGGAGGAEKNAFEQKGTSDSSKQSG